MDASPLDADAGLPDLKFSLIALVIEMERSVVARCPCQVKRGDYATQQACVDRVSFGRDWVDCLNMQTFPEDDLQIRAALRCQVAELQERSTCLEASTSCSEKDVAACLSIERGCPMPALKILSALVSQCPILFSH